MDYKVDYHIHSYYSDGTMSPVELVKKYNEEDYDIISITDHDNIKAFSEAKIAGEALDITVVPGVELSTEYGLTLAADADEQHPAGTEAAIELHLLGYQFDPQNAALVSKLAELEENRRARNEKLAAVLNEMGYPADLAALAAASKGGYVGKPNIARAWVAQGLIPRMQDAWEPGRLFESPQVKAIRNAVSHAVQGLSIDAVAIEDQFGNNYTAQDGITDVQDISALKMRLEEQTNNKIRTQVMQVLIPLFGEENIRVSVNSIVNMDRTYTDSTNYSGEEDGEGIIGDRVFEQEIIRGGDETAGGTVGTPSNADLNTYVQEQLNANGDEVLISNSGEEHSLVDTEKVQVEHLAGTVADVMVSVTINQSAAGGASANSLYPHVARAAGIGTELQNEKISILIQPFYQEGTAPIPVPDGVPAWMLYAALAGLGVFVILLMVVLLIRRRSKRRKKLDGVQTVQRAEEIPAPAPEGADIMDMKTEKSLELRRDVRKFAEENPEIAAQMVKNWLREGDDAG